MYGYMKYPSSPGSARLFAQLFVLAGSVLLIPTPDAIAASWQWSNQGSRERVVLDLDAARQDRSAGRTAGTEITVGLGSPLTSFARSGAVPAPGSLVSGVSSDGGAVRVQLRDAAFGYVVSRPAPQRVVIDVFPDPLGTRWRSPGTRAPANAPSRAVSAQPEPPVVSQPPRVQQNQGETSPTTSVPPAAQTARRTPVVDAAVAQQRDVPPPVSSQRIPMPDPGATSGENTTTLGKMAAGSRMPTPSPSRQERPLPQAGTAAGNPGSVPAAPFIASASQPSPSAASNAALSGNGAWPPPPSENDITALTERIETLPPSADDTAFAWPDLNQRTSSPPAEEAMPPLGTAERTALEKSLGVSPVPPAVPASEPTPLPVRESPIREPQVPERVNPQQAAQQTQQPVPPRSQENGTPRLPPGLADIGAVRGAIGAAPPVYSDGSDSMLVAGERRVELDEPPGLPVDVAQQRLSPDALEQADRSRVLAPNALRAQLNSRGPDDWPRQNGLTTLENTPVSSPQDAPPTPPRTLPPETREPMADAPAIPEPDVIYVDEDGNQIPKPLDTAAMIAEAHKLLNDKQPQEALDILQQLKDQPLAPGQREDVLYMISEATEKVHTGDWLKGYEPIVSTTNEAMNFNLRSPRVADALLRLGMINLKTGNQSEAAGYFGALKNSFPLKPDVPVAYLALGRDQFDKGQYAEAVQTFQLILDKYPESNAVREAARYMAEALYKQGHDSRALILVDFVNRRWPRLYLEDTDYLAMVGDLLNRQKRLDDALQTYWTYYNLIPDNPRNHEVLLHIGSIYTQTGFPKGARDVFEELLRKYPQSPSAPVALRRIGENGIYDGNPTLEELFAMFEKPNPTSPDIYYRKILDDYTDSHEAPVAALRLAAWRFWSKDIAPAMTLAQEFIRQHPNSPYGPRAEEILQQGFDQEFATAMEEENYDRILTLWDRYPEVRLEHPTLSDDLRVALGRAHLNRGEEDEGMALLSPFLDRPKDPKYGEYVYNLSLARALRTEDWNEILDIGEKVANWELAVPVRAQLDYARAISAENLGLAARALPLWRSLHTRNDIPMYQKAYATYFMARDAEQQRDLDEAYRLNLETLKLFTQLQEDRSDKADPDRIRESLAALMDVTEVMNRFAESLDWADKYLAFVPKDSPDYAAWQFRVARLHRKMGDLGRWQAMLDDIVAREPETVYGRMAASELRTQEVARDLTRFTPPE